MTEQTAQFLLSEPGRELLDRVDHEARVDSVRALIKLRKTEDSDHVSAAFEVHEARKKSASKFGDLGASMYFTVEALEQASSAGASAYHAAHFVDRGVTTVIDICGGIGGDTLAFARAGLNVILCEIDPARALFAAENARIVGLSDRIEVHNVDATEALDNLSPNSGSTLLGLGAIPHSTFPPAVWFDPARRVDNRRVNDPEDYRPPLSFLDRLRAHGFADIGAKLSPAIDHAVGQAYGGELEFISDQGECKEALLWAGKLATGEGTRAVVITRNGGISTISGSQATPSHSDGEGVLYEPDPAVIRAHLVQPLAARLGAHIIDPHIAYLLGPDLVETPFATAYAVVDRFPFHIKALNRALRERSVGRVVIKKRGFPQEPEQVRKQLKLTGDQEMTLVLTRVGQQHQVILCRPVKP